MSSNKPHREQVNRVEHIRRDTDTSKDVSLGLVDLDETIKYYFESVVKLQITDSNRVEQAVPIIYGSPERWKSAQKSSFYRDPKGKVQLPLVMYRRTSISKNRELGMKVDVNNPLYHFIENTYSKENKYDKLICCIEGEYTAPVVDCPEGYSYNSEFNRCLTDQTCKGAFDEGLFTCPGGTILEELRDDAGLLGGGVRMGNNAIDCCISKKWHHYWIEIVIIVFSMAVMGVMAILFSPE